jgi:hypothetical protein
METFRQSFVQVPLDQVIEPVGHLVVALAGKEGPRKVGQAAYAKVPLPQG